MCESLGGNTWRRGETAARGGYVKGQVKCLHAHYACYLATGGRNVVGRWVQRDVRSRGGRGVGEGAASDG